MPRRKRRKSLSERREHRYRLFHLSFRVLLLIFASALVLGYLSIFISPEKVAFPSFFGLYLLPIILLNIILLFLAMIRRSRSFWIPFLALMPSLFFGEFFYQPDRPQQPYADGEIRLMTYNVGLFKSNTSSLSADDRREAIMKFIRKENPDIVCLQEYSTRDTSAIKRYFREYPYLRYHLFEHDSGLWTGNLTASRYPIHESGCVTFRGSLNMSLWCDIEHDGHLYRLFNNHLESNAISLTSLIKKFRKKNDEFTSELEKVHEKMRVSVSKRSHQANEILENISDSLKPSIVCGDFNDIPVSYTFHRLYSGRKDTFCEAGQGAGATYSILWPLLRIDYTLIPETASALDHRTVKLPYSDHYPVLTRILLENEQKQ